MSGDHASAPPTASRSSSRHAPPAIPATLPPHGSTSTSRTSSCISFRQPRSSSAGHLNSSVVDFSQLEITSQAYDNAPQAAKRWLESFGEILSGTSVSLRLAAVRKGGLAGDTETSQQYFSMLPVLSRWLGKWFERALDARREKRRTNLKRNKKTTVEEEEDLEWVCKYITDYLDIEHEGLAEEDLAALIEAALDICGRVVHVADLERPLGVLKSVFLRYGCPRLVFERSLFVVCGIQGSVRELPTRFTDCLRYFLSDFSTDATAQKLHGFLRTDVSKLECTTVNAGRGAVQLLHRLIESKAIPDSLPGDLLTSLSSATSWHKQAVNEVALQLCSRLAAPHSSILSSSDQQFSEFMEIVNAAYVTIKVPKPIAGDNSSRPSRPSSSAPAGERSEFSDARDSVDSALEELLPSLTSLKQSLVFSHFINFAAQQPLDRFLRVLEHSEERIANQDDVIYRGAFCLQIIQKVTYRPELSLEMRLAATGVVDNVLSTTFNGSAQRDKDDSDGSWDSATNEILQELTRGIKIEGNAAVLEKIVETVVQVLLRHGSKDFVLETCGILAEVASREKVSEQTARCSEIAARALVSIFMRSMNSDDVDRTDLAYRKLVRIAGSFQISAEARLAALRLLLRIRCDSSGGIYVSQSSESEYLAAALCRTDDSAAKFSPSGESSDDQGTPRSSGVSLRRSRPTPPLWIYPGVPALPHIPGLEPSEYVGALGAGSASISSFSQRRELDLRLWLECVISCLQKDPDWETYSYVIVHIGAQLSNVRLLEGSNRHICFLRSVLCEQVLATSFHEPPAATGLKKGDVALCVFNALTPLIAYNSHFSRNENDKLVQAFVMGIGSFEGTSRGCVHSLSICCLEIPGSVAKSLSAIIHKIQTNATQSHLSMHYLEFVAGLGRLPQVHPNLHGDEVRLIFGICISYIKSMRDRRSHNQASAGSRNETATPVRNSGVSLPPFRAKILSAIELPQYVTALAYHTMIFWFLSLRLSERAKHVPWIIKSLIFVDNEGTEQLEEQSEVFIDMMQRTSFSDLGETLPHAHFAQERDGSISSASWLVGLSLVTIETAGATGLSQITKRQASGTTHSIYQQQTADLPSHHAPLTPDIRPETSVQTEMLPQHVLLQMVTTCAPTWLPSQPLPLPDAEYVKRAVRSFDRNPTVDGTKIGVIFVGPGQTNESDILSNTRGSPDFDRFLNGLGTKVKLDGAKFNTQGLRAERDGEWTYAWRDRVTEIVYHVPCMMPTNLEDDPQCTNKKMHIGNDHVNIIFNRSGEAFDFDTFGSQFNYVNIVVTPASRVASSTAPNGSTQTRETASSDDETDSPFYQVHTLTAENFPALSPTSDFKIISAKNLAPFVRIIALNASVFSLAWRDRDSPNDYVSSWRNRLQEIRRLRDRVTREIAAAAPEPRRGGALYASYGKGARTSLYPEGRGELTCDRRMPVVDYESAELGAGEDKSRLYDFLRWTSLP